MPSWLRRWPDYLPLTLLALTILTLFYRLIFGEVIFWGLPSLQFYPWRQFALSELAAGRLPLWNPYNGAGAPLLANYQIALLYPPNWLYLLLPGPQTMGLLGMAHLLLAGFGMWLLTGRLHCDRLGRGIATLAYPLSSTLVARFGTAPMLDVAAWLPWLMLAVDGMVDSVTIRRLLALSAVSAMLLLTGHAQWTFYCLALAGAYALWQVLSRRQTPVAVLRMVIAGAAALALAVGLAAAQLLPTAEYMAQSQRASGVDQTFALNFSYAPLSLLTLFNPNFFGNPGDGSYGIKGEYFETTAYVGILPAVLAILVTIHYLRQRRRRRESTVVSRPGTDTGVQPQSTSATGSPSPALWKRGPGDEVNRIPFFALVGIISVALAFGQYTPLGGLLYRFVPTFNLFQAPARWLLLTVFSLAILSAQATSFWQPTANRRVQRNIAVALIGSVILILAGLGAQIVLASAKPITHQLAQGMATTGVLALIASAIFATQPSNPLKRQRWQIAVLLFVALDLWWANSLSNPSVPASFYQNGNSNGAGRLFWPDPGNEQLPQSAFDGYLRPDDYRVAVQNWQSYRRSDLPDMNMLDLQPVFNNFDPLRPDGFERFSRLLNANPTPAPNLLRAAGIAQVVGSAAPATVPDRVWVVPQAVSAASPDAAEQAITAPGWDASQSVVVENPESPLSPTLSPMSTGEKGVEQDLSPGSPSPVFWERGTGGEVNLGASATILDESPLSLDIAVAVPPGGGFLVMADTFYPGWQATLGAQPAMIYRANVAFRAVAVPEGQHRVSMTYAPRTWQAGRTISTVSFGLAILLIFAALAANLLRRRKGQPGLPRLQE